MTYEMDIAGLKRELPLCKVSDDLYIGAFVMFGDVELKTRPADLKVQDETVMKVEHLTRAGKFEDVSFELKKGEVLGIAGMLGAGRTELLRSLFGVDGYDSGQITVNGQVMSRKATPEQMKHMGMGLTPEERKNQGVILIHSIRDNLCNACLDKISDHHIINQRRRKDFAERQVEELQIKVPSLTAAVGSLSGGNQQKVVIGKWVNTDADIFIFDEPTRGIDVGAKIEVYHVMNDLVKAGKCVIMVSSELPEILAMSDHVVVMRGGRVMANIDRDTPHFNSEDIMKAAWGGELD